MDVPKDEDYIIALYTRLYHPETSTPSNFILLLVSLKFVHDFMYKLWLSVSNEMFIAGWRKVIKLKG